MGKSHCVDHSKPRTSKITDKIFERTTEIQAFESLANTLEADQLTTIYETACKGSKLPC